MHVPAKNFQGFRLLGLDFATNYGQSMYGCFQFDFMDCEISVSTGAVNTQMKMFPVCLEPINITDKDGKTYTINGTVQDAINFVLSKQK